jgi:flagellin
MTLTYSANIGSMTIANILKKNQFNLEKSMQRLATGFKINSSADGSAAMTIGINLDSQIRGYDVAATNIQQGISMLSTADSALQSMVGHLQNIRDISIAASNSTTTASQFTSYQAQLTAEIAAVNSISNNTKYDTNVLLDGSIAGGAAFNIQFGPNTGDALDIKTAFTDNDATTLTIAQTTLSTTAHAGTLLGQVNAAIDTVNGNLGLIGGFQSRLTDQLAYVDIAKTNYVAAQSTIRDTDVAQETANLTRLQIMQQAGAYALAQANSTPQLALSLLT